MSLRHVQLEQITQAHLEALIDNEVSESKEIDYKEQLSVATEGDKKEFLADVVSFANCGGGDMLYGVSERRDDQNRPMGVPASLKGIVIPNLDLEKLRLESLVRDGIEPRIAGVAFQPVPLDGSRAILIIRIPQSWSSPHMVKYQNASRFYSRNSAGKYPLDVNEIRNAFPQGETLANKLRDFRLDRLAQIANNAGPVKLGGMGIIVLHLIPFQAFDPGLRFALAPLVKDSKKLEPVYATGWKHRYNFEGIVSYSTSQQPNAASSYLQVFRPGIIEAADTGILERTDPKAIIPSILYEEEIIKGARRYLSLQMELGVRPPIALMLSFLNVKGYEVVTKSIRNPYPRSMPIDRGSLVLPEAIVESFSVDVAGLLKPAFDAVWNAAGWPGSLNYDANGNWRPHS